MGDYQADLNRQTLNIMQTCKVMGVSRRTIYNWIRDNKLEYYRTPGGEYPYLLRPTHQRAHETVGGGVGMDIAEYLELVINRLKAARESNNNAQAAHILQICAEVCIEEAVKIEKTL